MIDTPMYADSRGDCHFMFPAGREIVVGRVFNGNRGYRVTLKFSDSSKANSLSAETAKALAADMRGQGASNADAIALADEIGRWADSCERLNAGWVLMGSPAGGFDALAHGNA
jgi:hypothetical protein